MENFIDVKPKENRTWTDTERQQIYTLKDRCTALELAQLYNTSVYQIHNLHQHMKKLYGHRCFRCGKPMTSKELRNCKGYVKACSECKKAMRDYKARLRAEALKAGKCEYCKRRKKLPGRTACGRCLSATYRRRNLAGLCVCGKEPVRFKGAAFGEKCIKEQRSRVKRGP
jgi:hypothetical protein